MKQKYHFAIFQIIFQSVVEIMVVGMIHKHFYFILSYYIIIYYYSFYCLYKFYY